MTTLHTALRDGSFWLFRLVDGTTGLVVLGAVTGAVLAIAFRLLSRPDRIRAARQRAFAELLTIRLYRHDVRVVFLAQLRLLRATAAYVGTMLVPVLVLAVPVTLLLAHLEARYGARPVMPGEPVVVEAVARDGVGRWSLDPSSGVSVEAGPVRIPERSELAWRVRVSGPGPHRLRFGNGESTVAVPLTTFGEHVPVARRHAAAGVVSLFTAPFGDPIPPDAGLVAIDIAYPDRPTTIAGRELPWIAVFLTTTVVVALILKRPLRVEF